MENVRNLPITMDANGDLIIKRGENGEAIKHLIKMFEVFTENYMMDTESTKKELRKSNRIVGELGEAVGTQTEKVESLDQTVGSFDNRLTESELANIAPDIIRNELRQERREKASHFVENTVQLTFEAVEGTKSDLERNVELLMEKETTKVMRQITSYVKRQLELRSIDNIPICFVPKHKQLLKELTWKKLDNYMKNGK
ncbi:hypothetical protein IIU_05074 [Bacillus cereus VD133]|uniref:Uncharacterized protein n=1 Tax=Bacillus cereus VD133 TaxID=1053233 RepID=A0A9W5PN33_BACCE|nr:hypothetical protein [Bacillus cereus]EOO30757.1 hypothetical protein IIU_05074 [Bacillus cereus VD133]